jgi:hypothetical protein
MIAQEKVRICSCNQTFARWNAATQLSFPSAMWRLPNEQKTELPDQFFRKPLQAKS